MGESLVAIATRATSVYSASNSTLNEINEIRVCTGAAEVIVSAQWFDRLASRGPQETPFLSPDLARRGRLVRRDGLFLRFCGVCGAGASFGYAVEYRAGKPGNLYCGAHRPQWPQISSWG